MHIVLAVCCLLIAGVVSYPSVRKVATDDEDSSSDLRLELRSILNRLDNKQMERSMASGEDVSNEDDKEMNKRQVYGQYTPQQECKRDCFVRLTAPNSGQPMSPVKALETCKNACGKK